jgi:hypothetical protein
MRLRFASRKAIASLFAMLLGAQGIACGQSLIETGKIY